MLWLQRLAKADVYEIGRVEPLLLYTLRRVSMARRRELGEEVRAASGALMTGVVVRSVISRLRRRKTQPFEDLVLPRVRMSHALHETNGSGRDSRAQSPPSKQTGTKQELPSKKANGGSELLARTGSKTRLARLGGKTRLLQVFDAGRAVKRLGLSRKSDAGRSGAFPYDGVKPNGGRTSGWKKSYAQVAPHRRKVESVTAGIHEIITRGHWDNRMSTCCTEWYGRHTNRHDSSDSELGSGDGGEPVDNGPQAGAPAEAWAKTRVGEGATEPDEPDEPQPGDTAAEEPAHRMTSSSVGESHAEVRRVQWSMAERAPTMMRTDDEVEAGRTISAAHEQLADSRAAVAEIKAENEELRAQLLEAKGREAALLEVIRACRWGDAFYSDRDRGEGGAPSTPG